MHRMALWSHDKRIVIPIVVIILGHWSLILQGVLLNAVWVPGQGCVVTSTNNTILAATFIYSMCFDFFVLIMTGIKLAFPAVRQNQSRIVQLIFTDGLIFFIVA